MEDIAANIEAIRALIINYEKKYHRAPNSVLLLGASKSQSVAKLQLAYHAGLINFGESYLQEALKKIEHLKDLADIVWHFIGPIQSNKTRKIAENFHWVHSLDDAKIAERLNDQRPSHLPPLNVCIEININAEDSKHGVSFNHARKLLDLCKNLSNLKLRGLMCIPKPTDDMSLQRENFKKLTDFKETLSQEGIVLDTLSMGMSQDFEAAIAEGSTLVRIGTGIFGKRSIIAQSRIF